METYTNYYVVQYSLHKEVGPPFGVEFLLPYCQCWRQNESHHVLFVCKVAGPFFAKWTKERTIPDNNEGWPNHWNLWNKICETRGLSYKGKVLHTPFAPFELLILRDRQVNMWMSENVLNITLLFSVGKTLVQVCSFQWFRASYERKKKSQNLPLQSLNF